MVWLDCDLLAPRDVTPETCLLLGAYHEAFTRMGIRLTIAHASPELQRGLLAEGETDALAVEGWLVETFNPVVPLVG